MTCILIPRPLITDLVAHGLDGLEVFYSGHEFMQIKQYRRLATDLELIITAGSDYHGEKIKPKNMLGMDVKEEKMNYCWGYDGLLR